MAGDYLKIPRVLVNKLEMVCERSKLPIEDALQIAINDYVENEELRFRMEDDYEAGTFAA